LTLREEKKNQTPTFFVFDQIVVTITSWINQVTTTNEFDSQCVDSLRRHGFKPRASSDLLEWWHSFVGQCEGGYRWTIYELDDELSVRDYIEVLLTDPVVAKFEEFASFAERVAELDKRFKALLKVGITRPASSQTWWRQGILRFAGDEYRSDIANQYSIPVEPAE
jgi:hypothetical protein